MMYRTRLTDIDYADNVVKPELFTYAQLDILKGFKKVGTIHYSSWERNICLISFENEEHEELFFEQAKKTYENLLEKSNTKTSFPYLKTEHMKEWYGTYLANQVINGEGLINRINMFLSGRQFGIKVTEF